MTRAPEAADPTFVRVEGDVWHEFITAATVDCPSCPAKKDYPCFFGVTAGYHRPRLREADRPQRLRAPRSEAQQDNNTQQKGSPE